MRNRSTLAALAAALALAVTAVSAAEPVPVEREKATKRSDVPKEVKRLPASDLPSSGGTQDKGKERAADSKRRHGEAMKIIDNLKD